MLPFGQHFFFAYRKKFPPYDFLNTPLHGSQLTKLYMEAKHKKVVNDSAERSEDLMSSCNESITKNKQGIQELIQVVEGHRKQVSDACSQKHMHMMH